MNTAVGVASLITAIGYLLLGAMVARDLIRGRAPGFSHFGVGFLAMFVTCGTHHLIHAVHVLVEGQRAAPALLVALLTALPAGVLVVGLRIESTLGGRGDRFITRTPWWLSLAPIAAGIVIGVTAIMLVATARSSGVDPLSLVPNLVLAIAYSAVGWYILRTQARRRAPRGGWSVAGLAFGTVFPACALVHVAMGITMHADIHVLIVALGLQGPAALYFLWAVRRLYRRSSDDWNTLAQTGAQRQATRPSPWPSPALSRS